jgi:adenosine deaminase
MLPNQVQPVKYFVNTSSVSAFALNLPKVQLHCHLEGTIEPGRFRDLAKAHEVDIGARAIGPEASAFAFSDFGEFLLLFADVCKVLQTPDDFAALAADYAASARAQSVRYAELFISPSVWTYFHRDLDAAAAVRAMREEFDRAQRDGGPHVAFIADLTRNFGAERALETARFAATLGGERVIGIGLGGDERRFPAELYAGSYALAHAAGLHRVAHAGEADGPASVRAAIDVLGAERIGHGVRSAEDPELVALLAEREIPLEICPTSNRLTGAVAAGQPHPLAAFLEAGVRCAIDADDPTLFGTSVSAEIAWVEVELGRQAVAALAHTAIEASFANPSRKAALRRELRDFCAEERIIVESGGSDEHAGSYALRRSDGRVS